jgi:hypothetical protein
VGIGRLARRRSISSRSILDVEKVDEIEQVLNVANVGCKMDAADSRVSIDDKSTELAAKSGMQNDGLPESTTKRPSVLRCFKRDLLAGGARFVRRKTAT